MLTAAETSTFPKAHFPISGLLCTLQPISLSDNEQPAAIPHQLVGQYIFPSDRYDWGLLRVCYEEED